MDSGQFQHINLHRLKSGLSQLNQGEALPTLPFSYAKGVGRQYGCSYSRLSLINDPRYAFVKGLQPPFESVNQCIYQGETLASRAKGWNHYLDYFVMGLGPTSRFDSQYLRPHNIPMEELLMKGSSPITAWTDFDKNIRTPWTRLIDSYLAPFFPAQVRYKELKAFMQILAKYSGQLFASCKIANECKNRSLLNFKTQKKVTDAVERLQIAGVWNVLRPVEVSVGGTRPPANKTIGYFCDSGLLTFLLRCRRYVWEKLQLKQLLFWHYVLNDMNRHLAFNHPEVTVHHYWRPPIEQPVVVLKTPELLLPVWISYENADNRFYRWMDYIPEFSNNPKLVVQAAPVCLSTIEHKNIQLRARASFDLAIRIKETD